MGRLERGISADALRRELLARAHQGKADLSLTKAKDTAKRLSRTSTVKWATVETRDGYAVLPKPLADRWKAATREPVSSGARSTPSTSASCAPSYRSAPCGTPATPST